MRIIATTKSMRGSFIKRGSKWSKEGIKRIYTAMLKEKEYMEAWDVEFIEKVVDVVTVWKTKEFYERFHRVVSKLIDKDVKVLKYRFEFDTKRKTLKEVGRIMKVSPTMIRVREERALCRLFWRSYHNREDNLIRIISDLSKLKLERRKISAQ